MISKLSNNTFYRLENKQQTFGKTYFTPQSFGKLNIVEASEDITPQFIENTIRQFPEWLNPQWILNLKDSLDNKERALFNVFQHLTNGIMQVADKCEGMIKEVTAEGRTIYTHLCNTALGKTGNKEIVAPEQAEIRAAEMLSQAINYDPNKKILGNIQEIISEASVDKGN